MTSSHKLTFRIYLATETPAEDIISNQTFVTWAKKQKLLMIRSRISTAKPAFAGFYTEPNPEKKKIEFLEDKIQLLLGNDKIEYQVVIKPIFVEGKGSSSFVYMVLADKDDLSQLRTTLKNSDKLTARFIPWDQYCDLPREKKLHIIQSQQQANLKYRSTVIGGFTNDNPTMDYEETDDESEEEEDDELDEEGTKNGNNENMEDELDSSVEDESQLVQHTLTYNETEEKEPIVDLPPSPTMMNFITEYFTDHQGDPIFPLAWGPLKGKVQLHYRTINQNQAEAIIEILHPELAKHMTETSIHIAFQNPQDVIDLAFQTEPWTPYTLAHEIPSVETTETTEKTKHEPAMRKRNKTSTYSMTGEDETETTLKEPERKNKDNTKDTSDQRVNTQRQKPIRKWETTTNDNQPTRRTSTNNDHPTASPAKRTSNEGTEEFQPEYKQLLTDINEVCTQLIKESQKEMMTRTEQQIQQLRIETTGTTKRIEKSIKDNQKKTDDKIEKIEISEKETKTAINNIYATQSKMLAILTRIDRELVQTRELNRKERDPEPGNQTPEHNKVRKVRQDEIPMEVCEYIHQPLLDTPAGQASTNEAICKWNHPHPNQSQRTATPSDSNTSCEDDRSYAAGSQ